MSIYAGENEHIFSGLPAAKTYIDRENGEKAELHNLALLHRSTHRPGEPVLPAKILMKLAQNTAVPNRE